MKCKTALFNHVGRSLIVLSLVLLFFGVGLYTICFDQVAFSRLIYTNIQAIFNSQFHQIYENVYMEDVIGEEREHEIIDYIKEVMPKTVGYENDYIIILTNRELTVNVDYAQGEQIVGTANHAEKIITIKYDYVEHSLLHEVGHVVDTMCGYSNTDQFMELYDKASIDAYYTRDAREYFAHNYSLFIKDQLCDLELYKYYCKILYGYSLIIGG